MTGCVCTREIYKTNVEYFQQKYFNTKSSEYSEINIDMHTIHTERQKDLENKKSERGLSNLQLSVCKLSVKQQVLLHWYSWSPKTVGDDEANIERPSLRTGASHCRACRETR